MRAIIIVPMAVSSSTQGMTVWLAYGWNLSISPHSTRNSTAPTPKRSIRSPGRLPTVRSNIWKNAKKLTSMAISSREI